MLQSNASRKPIVPSWYFRLPIYRRPSASAWENMAARGRLMFAYQVNGLPSIRRGYSCCSTLYNTNTTQSKHLRSRMYDDVMCVPMLARAGWISSPTLTHKWKQKRKSCNWKREQNLHCMQSAENWIMWVSRGKMGQGQIVQIPAWCVTKHAATERCVRALDTLISSHRCSHHRPARESQGMLGINTRHSPL